MNALPQCCLLYTSVSNNVCIKDCISNVTIISSDYSGGIIGKTDNASENVCIENCVNEADLDGRTNVGGIIGNAYGRYEQSVKILNCTNKGKVNGGHERCLLYTSRCV